MPLLILGLLFAVGLFVYYMLSTGSSEGSGNSANGRTGSSPNKKNKEDVQQTMSLS